MARPFIEKLLVPWAAIHQGQGGRVPPKKFFGGDKGINVPPNNKESVVATGKNLEKL